MRATQQDDARTIAYGDYDPAEQDLGDDDAQKVAYGDDPPGDDPPELEVAPTLPIASDEPDTYDTASATPVKKGHKKKGVFEPSFASSSSSSSSSHLTVGSQKVW